MAELITNYADLMAPVRTGTLVQMWLRAALIHQLAGLRHGALLLAEPGRAPVMLGAPSAGTRPIEITIRDPAFYVYACLGGSVGLGEAYMLGYWGTSDLVGATRLLIRNIERLDALDTGLPRLKQPLLNFFKWRHRNHPDGSRLNIAAHYDLGNAFFSQFLDADMTYSSAIYQNADDTLHEAQVNKLDTICRKLQLTPDDHVVEIGSGWGSFALHAATKYGARVTTTTLSREQQRYATARVKAAGLQDRVRVLLSDYRELEGSYDKLVSIEMIEAVGHEFYPAYMRACERLLKPQGQALIQLITCADQRYEAYRKSTDFIRRYIFPGGNLPSITHLLEVTTRHTRMCLADLQYFPADYSRTLAEWRSRFLARQVEIRNLGYSETFIRMWDFYLATCEAAFAERFIGVAHLLFTQPGCRRETVAS